MGKKNIIRFLFGVLLGGLSLKVCDNFLEDFPPQISCDENSEFFDKLIWNNPDSLSKRQAMLYDLKNFILKDYMTKKEVIEILGQPDKNQEFKLSKNSLIYEVGTCSGPCFLEISFSNNLINGVKKHCKGQW
ncbi:hypothetical protein [Flammeovirga sp. SJP92]|uniref:hypothetical protein n=1 Tax=Flammeovirga sp. SJP92 TaxID=1775430 RepID=UPI0012FC0417|nr:hypothetical protein [Flammeovirga sp. SJP92]